MGNDEGGRSAWRRAALPAIIGVVVLGIAIVTALKVAAHRAYSRAGAFCAAAPPGTSARDVTIRALDQSVQVRTDIEPGALVVRFPAWGSSTKAGECRMALDGDHVAAVRVERIE